MEYSIKTHNGAITMHNRDTGNHRTLRISTVQNDESPLNGKRILSLLIGPDNGADGDYNGFAFVNDDGRIAVWKRYRGESPDKRTDYERFAAMLEREDRQPGAYPQVDFLFETVCRVCNRPLTTPDSIRWGIGPICLARSFK